MELCDSTCKPHCDDCRWAKHGSFEKDLTTRPIACKKHPDEEEYQAIAKSNGVCPDFKCLRIRGV